MPRVILHVGADKCGSSALQTALTTKPVLRGQLLVLYGVIDRRGSVISGQRISPGPSGYRNSIAGRDLSRFTDDQLAELSQQLTTMACDAVILSNEGWLREYRVWRELLPRLSVPVEIVVYVRPQVAFLNSSWWQWGAWSNADLASWIERALPGTFWATFISAWMRMQWVTSVTVRLLLDDVVSDMFQVLGVDPREDPHLGRVNKSLPASLLRLYQRHRSLRPTAHSADIDFVLARHTDLAGATPWVLDQPTVRHVIDAARDSNLVLLDLLDPASRSVMKKDPKWWDPDAFADKTLEPWQPQPPNAHELDVLCAELARAVYHLGKHVQATNGASIGATLSSSESGSIT